MIKMIEQAVKLFSLQDYDCHEIEGHEGGRNRIFVCSKDGEKRFVLRISATGDRTEKDYLAETEFVHYLAQNGAPVADVIPSVNGKLVEVVEASGGAACDGGATPVFISLFEYAKGMLLCNNDYRYREGAPLEEYFFNTGKTLGKIHALAKCYVLATDYRRPDYFDTILEGYKTQTTLDNTLLNQLPLFIDMVLLENIVDEFECAAREGEEVDFEDIEEAAKYLMKK